MFETVRKSKTEGKNFNSNDDKRDQVCARSELRISFLFHMSNACTGPGTIPQVGTISTIRYYTVNYRQSITIKNARLPFLEIIQMNFPDILQFYR